MESEACKDRKEHQVLQQSQEDYITFSLGIVGRSDRFISSPSPSTGLFLTAVMKLSVTKRQQLRHPANYLKVREITHSTPHIFSNTRIKRCEFHKSTLERFTRSCPAIFSLRYFHPTTFSFKYHMLAACKKWAQYICLVQVWC